MKSSLPGIIMGFVILFALYHWAEYMVVFKDSVAGFLVVQVLFFMAAWAIGRLQFGNGFEAWGLSLKGRFYKHLLAGIVMGLLLYGCTFLISIVIHAESVATVPSFKAIAGPLLLFVFGNFFSSFSEDILTRGYVYRHLQNRISSGFIVFISAVVFVLNHIYRYNSGIETQVYLFALGLTLVVPLVLTKKLWFTGGMHWAGNCFFYATHQLMTTNDNNNLLVSPNYILAALAVIFIGINYFVIKAFRLDGGKTA